MFFNVLRVGGRPPSSARSKAFLITDNWDDWFEFSTMFSLVFVNEEGARRDVGSVKIGQFDMPKGQPRADIPESFDALNELFFSLGQDDSYYENLNNIGAETRDRILVGLRDLALAPEVFDRALKERVTGISLLRSVTPATVRGQFHRLARGGARLSRYEFSYTAPRSPRSLCPGVNDH
jgi:hypothetical protein